MGYIGNLIANIIGLIGGAILSVVIAIFSALNIQIPSGFLSAFQWIVGFFSFANGFLPMATIIICGLWFLAVFLLKYKINLFLHTIFPFIPLIGKKVELPHVASSAEKKK
jgi:hypothetical protein